MSHDRKWQRTVESFAQDAGLKVVAITRHRTGHLRVVVAHGDRSDVITTTRTDGDTRLWLNTRAQFRRVARALTKEKTK